MPQPKIEAPKDRIFDQFFIIGAPPDSVKGNKPQILSMFPSTQIQQTDDELSQIVDFCFPSKFQTIPDAIPASTVILNEFIFLLNKEHAVTEYGICVQIRSPPEAAPFFSTNWSRRYPFCLCLLTNKPYLSSHFEFLTFLALFLCGKVVPNKLPFGRAPLPVRGFCHPSLTLDSSSPAIAVCKGFRSPRLLIDELSLYYSLPTQHKNVPHFGHPYAPGYPLAIPLHFSRAQNIAYASFHALFSSLTPTLIVNLYTAMLLERHILLVSKSPHKFSLSVIALTTLFRPFKSQTSLLPVLPDKSTFHQFLGSPVPFVAGSTYSDPNVEVVVDLDQGTLTMLQNIPKLPRQDILIRKLDMLLNNDKTLITVPPSETRSFFGGAEKNPAFDEFFTKLDEFIFPHSYLMIEKPKYVFTRNLIDAIRESFASHIAPGLSEQLTSYFVTDSTDEEHPITVLNRDLVETMLIQGPEKEFYQIFCSTQIFSDFVERMSNDFQQMKKDPVKHAELYRSKSVQLLNSPTRAISPFYHNSSDEE